MTYDYVKESLRGKGIQKSSCGIRNQEHVALLNLLETSDRRTIEPRAAPEYIFQLMNGLARVLECSRNIHKREVRHGRLMLLGKIENILGRFDLGRERKIFTLVHGFCEDGIFECGSECRHDRRGERARAWARARKKYKVFLPLINHRHQCFYEHKNETVPVFYNTLRLAFFVSVSQFIKIPTPTPTLTPSKLSKSITRC